MRLTHFKVSQRELDLPDQGLGAPGGREVDQVIRRVGLLGQASNPRPRTADGVETAARLLDDLGPVLLNGVRRRRRRCRVSERSQQVLLEGVGPGCQPTLHSSAPAFTVPFKNCRSKFHFHRAFSMSTRFSSSIFSHQNLDKSSIKQHF